MVTRTNPHHQNKLIDEKSAGSAGIETALFSTPLELTFLLQSATEFFGGCLNERLAGKPTVVETYSLKTVYRLSVYESFSRAKKRN